MIKNKRKKSNIAVELFAPSSRKKIETGFGLEIILAIEKTTLNEKSPTSLLNFLLPLAEKKTEQALG